MQPTGRGGVRAEFDAPPRVRLRRSWWENGRAAVTVPTAAGGDPRRVLRIVTVGAAYVAQAVLLVPFTIASGLLAPLWAVLTLYVVWVVATALLVRTARRRPFAAPLVPLANAVVLWLVLTLGDAVLGWTA